MRPAHSLLVAALALLAPAASATIVKVTIRGHVAFNLITKPPMNGIVAGQNVGLSFKLDTDEFLDSVNFPTRGYAIDKSSFTLAFYSISVGLQGPFPAGQTPYFVIRNDDPAVDGFFLSTDVDGPTGLPLALTGSHGHYVNNFSVTYDGSTLPSLDLLDALGDYDYTGLTVFNWGVDDGIFTPLGIDFDSIHIQILVPSWIDAGHALAGVTGEPKLIGSGIFAGGFPCSLDLSLAAPNALAGLVVGLSTANLPFKGGVLVPAPDFGPVFSVVSGGGGIALPVNLPVATPPGIQLWMQWAIQDAAAVHGVALSNAVLATTQP